MNKFIFFYNAESKTTQHEVDLYRDLTNQIEFVEIHSKEFKNYSVSLQDAQSNRVVILENGKIIKGLEALFEAWKRIPRLQFLVPVVSQLTVRPLALMAFQIYKSTLKK